MLELLNLKFIQNNKNIKKIQIIIFSVITFLPPYILGTYLYFTNYINPEHLAGYMMILPISAVSISKLFTEGKGNGKHKFYRNISFFFLLYSILFLALIFKLISGGTYSTLSDGLLFVSSIYVVYFCFLSDDLYIFKNISGNIKLIVYFIFVRLLYAYIICIAYRVKLDLQQLAYCIFLPFTFFIVVYMFIGEEYGWRYFLQKILFCKFGRRRGVILLGVIWGLWHLPLQFILYSPDTPFLGAITHMIDTVGFSIFIGYVYLKTDNIIFCSFIHFLNNALTSIIPESVSKQPSPYPYYYDILIILIFSLVIYVPFIFTKEYKQEE